MLFPLALGLLLQVPASAPQAAPQERLQCGDVRTLEFAAPAEGESAAPTAQHFGISVDSLTRIWVWCEHGVTLRLEDTAGKVLFEDDGGALGRSPCIFLELRPGPTAVVRASLRVGAAPGRFELNVRCSRESTELRAALVKGKSALASAREKGASAALRASVLAGLRTELDGLFSIAGADESWECAALAMEFGKLAWGLEDPRLALDACEHCRGVRARLQPEDNVERLDAERCVGMARGQLGDGAGSVELLEHVLKVRERSAAPVDADLQAARQDLAVALSKAGKRERACTLMREALAACEGAPGQPGLRLARLNLAYTLRDSDDLPGARALFEQVLEAQAQTLPEESAEALQVRWDLAYALRDLGDRAAARAELERILEITLRAHADDGPEVQLARIEVASTLCELGELEPARVLQEQALASALRGQPEDSPFVQRARADLAVTLKRQGQDERARALEEQVLDVRERTLPEGHPDLLNARMSFANSLAAQGELGRARSLLEKVEAQMALRSPPDPLALARVRGNLAAVLAQLGETQAALQLGRQVLEVFLGLFPEDSPDVQMARQNLAASLMEAGELASARTLFEKVLEVKLRRLPEDDLEVQAARVNLANALTELGDFGGARLLQLQALEVYRRVLPAGHSLVLTGTENLAVTEVHMKEFASAREHLELVLKGREATLTPDDPGLQSVRMNLSVALSELGEHARARELLEQALAARTRMLGADSQQVQDLRLNLAQVIELQGDHDGALALREQALSGLARILPDDSPDVQSARQALIYDCLRAKRSERAQELLHALVEALRRSWDTAALSAAPREVGARVERDLPLLDCVLSCAAQPGPAQAQAAAVGFECVETLRCADLVSSALLSVSARDENLRARRARLTQASEQLAQGLRRSAPENELQELTRERDAAQSAWVELIAARPEAGAFLKRPALADLAAALGKDRALVCFWRYHLEGAGAHMNAFVLRGGGQLASIDLGPVEPVRQAIEDWRAQLSVPLERGRPLAQQADAEQGARASGERLRALVFDPLRAALGDARTLVFVLDDWLHAVPLDALPFENGLLGERYAMQLRASARELVWPVREPPASGDLLALGGASFNSRPQDPTAPLEASATRPDEPQIAAGPRPPELRGSGMELGFGPLSHSSEEVRSLGELYTEVFGRQAVVLEKRAASRPELEQRASSTRFLHVATHAWYAPESVPSSGDANTGGQSELVRGLSPMLLCGLALAGANLPPDQLGKVSGVVTAEEIASWDLSGCELAVLSACQTHVGVQRAGQGLASLQKALQLAGARSVITSLWRVPDEATKELMLDFYRRFWVQKKPKDRALWEAKMAIRAAKDEQGRPRYATHDWAGWVLTGDPH